MLRSVVVIGLVGACGFEGAGQSVAELPDARLEPDASVTSVEDDAPAPLPNAPVAYWSFDVDARDRTGAHDGVMVGTAVISDGGRGRQGEALVLRADGDRVDITNAMGFDFNTDFTWHVYFQSTRGSGALFSRNPQGTAWNQGSKALFVRSDSVQWDTGWVGNPQLPIDVSDEEWHQVIVRYVAAADQLDIFYDPIIGAPGTLSTTHNVNAFDEHVHEHLNGVAHTGFSIGAANFTGGLSDLNTLVGRIDEAAVFAVALQGEDLDRLIQSGPAAFFP